MIAKSNTLSSWYDHSAISSISLGTFIDSNDSLSCEDTLDSDSSCFDGLNDLFAYEEALIEVEENVKVASLYDFVEFDLLIPIVHAFYFEDHSLIGDDCLFEGELSDKVSSFKPFDSLLFDCEMESLEFDLDLSNKGSIFEKLFEITNEIVLEAKLFEKEESSLLGVNFLTYSTHIFDRANLFHYTSALSLKQVDYFHVDWCYEFKKSLLNLS